jgi:hypothetical protein
MFERHEQNIKLCIQKRFFIQLVDFVVADFNPLFYSGCKKKTTQYESFNKIDAPLVINSLQ